MCRAVVVVSATLSLAACVGYDSPPRVVDASQPSVTYEYTDDSELVLATQKAETYCARYQGWPETRSVTPNQDGTNTVVFTCNSTPPPAPLSPVVTPTPPAAPSTRVSYTVGSDTELVNALRSASAYCRQRAMEADTIDIAPNGDGSRTVSFRCIAA